ncbi:MAG: hypothetical protein K9K84_10865 [Methylovulum sp.]|nr:hypothetical protein [Methylovulum sp.]
MLGKPMSHSEQLSQTMSCRIGCGACCIAPSISSTLPLHPHGKAAGVRCLHLDEKYLSSFSFTKPPPYLPEFSGNP